MNSTQKIKDSLTAIRQVRNHEKLLKMIDYVNLQAAQAQKLNQQYQAGLKKDPHSFETAYKAIGVLGINSEIFNEKIEILEQFLKEMDKRIELLTDLVEDTLLRKES